MNNVFIYYMFNKSACLFIFFFVNVFQLQTYSNTCYEFNMSKVLMCKKSYCILCA